MTEKRLEAGGSLLGVLKGALYGRIVRESDVKVRVQRLLPELRKLVEELFREVQELTGSELFFIVDDLEKLSPLDTALGLFMNHGGFFGGLPCHLIFTAPGSLTLDARYQSDVLRHFREIRALLSNPTDEQGATAEMDALRRLVYRRMAPELAEEAAVDEAIIKTGGLLSHLIDVLHQSILLAIVDEEPQVGIHHIRKALKEISLRFFSVLTEEDYLALDRLEGSGLRSHMGRPIRLLRNALGKAEGLPLSRALIDRVGEEELVFLRRSLTPNDLEALAGVRRTHRADGVSGALLASGAVLAYQEGNDVWFAVHPALAEWMDVRLGRRTEPVVLSEGLPQDWIERFGKLWPRIRESHPDELRFMNDVLGDPEELARLYVEPGCQQVKPANLDEDAPGRAVREPIRVWLNEFFRGEVLRPDGGHTVFVLSHLSTTRRSRHISGRSIPGPGGIFSGSGSPGGRMSG